MATRKPSVTTALTCYGAGAVHAQYIVTSNVKDFKESTVPVITPADICKLMKSD